MLLIGSHLSFTFVTCATVAERRGKSRKAPALMLPPALLLLLPPRTEMVTRSCGVNAAERVRLMLLSWDWKGRVENWVSWKPVTVEFWSSLMLSLMVELFGMLRLKPYANSSWLVTCAPKDTSGRKTGPTAAIPGMVKPGMPMSGKGAVRVNSSAEAWTVLSSSMWAAKLLTRSST